jgi:hypothetical protein
MFKYRNASNLSIAYHKFTQQSETVNGSDEVPIFSMINVKEE